MTSRPDSDAPRQAWLAVLALAPRAALAERAPAAVAAHRFEWLREPETGLALVRGRIANRGDRFNVGEATLTRCIARVTLGNHTTAGVGHVLGRDDERVRWIAQLDALLQQPTLHDTLQREVIAPLQAARAQCLAAEQARHAASRVSFYTLRPEVAAP
ncbi:phosphonate C-P lyase system protein PhnG [Rhizobacter sp. J219]|uniref:phosphonate C-P lyase system protein PhnG n=1 Tax=Rhizobacter sp. J219 TaxID=2898430 RepID=UPI002151F407|nr:phosphonate C-P lyase system protein PhnG [Rhizobacter sp. J219]MCR5884813.1 phosphonate C-P lyase system protein PhnG [Rhizobacter sp. J219]